MGDDEEPTHDPAAGESDEEDEDYVPGADPDEPRDDDDDDPAALGDAGADARPALSAAQLRAVDDAFLDLFGYPYTHAASKGKKSDAKLPLKGKRATTRKERILASIFGKRASLQLLSRAKATAASARPKPRTGGMIRLEKRVVTEVKRFAGQEIRVERVVVVPVMEGEDDDAKMDDATTTSNVAALAGGASSRAATTRKGKAKGVDNLLAELDKPEKLSTISKTSADWDLFKNKEADASLKEQLEAKAKGNEAYLVKKDFLNRVDTRRFELEKAERDKKRARRGK